MIIFTAAPFFHADNNDPVSICKSIPHVQARSDLAEIFPGRRFIEAEIAELDTEELINLYNDLEFYSFLKKTHVNKEEKNIALIRYRRIIRRFAVYS